MINYPDSSSNSSDSGTPTIKKVLINSAPFVENNLKILNYERSGNVPLEKTKPIQG
jgi:hypothetical protein